MNQVVKISKSKKHGSGLFALKHVQKGERVYSFEKGRILTSEAIKNLTPQEKMHLDKIGEDEFEVIGPPACSVNHSCEPNVEEKDRIGYAIKDIDKGEEVTIDYDLVAHLEKPFNCRCGSKNCRGFVRGRR